MTAFLRTSTVVTNIELQPVACNTDPSHRDLTSEVHTSVAASTSNSLSFQNLLLAFYSPKLFYIWGSLTQYCPPWVQGLLLQLAIISSNNMRIGQEKEIWLMATEADIATGTVFGYARETSSTWEENFGVSQKENNSACDRKNHSKGANCWVP